MPSPSSDTKDRLSSRINELPPRPDSGWTDTDLAHLGEVFIDAILTSASVDVIGVSHWWDRARSALETGVAIGDSIRSVAARTARKLQVETMDPRTGRAMQAIQDRLGDPQDFARWRLLCRRDAVFLVAMVRLHREDHREATQSKKTKAAKETLIQTPTAAPIF